MIIKGRTSSERVRPALRMVLPVAAAGSPSTPPKIAPLVMGCMPRTKMARPSIP